ncbi:MAG: hypothetical protein ACYC4L_10470 [Chloroflexota bacterium]
MEMTFERGEQARPRGHALIYFRNSKGDASVLASYLIVPPVPLNLARYMPPMFAASMPTQDAQTSAVPLPPVPEPFESRAALERLAEARGDDLLYGGNLDPDDVQRGLLAVTEAAHQYQRLYEEHLRHLPKPEPELAEGEGTNVNDVLFSLMSERQLLGELAKLVGTLRYALEGGDARQVKETVREMEALGRHVPEKYRVDELIAAAQQPGAKGQRLSQLYVDRCFRLSDEDYAGLGQIEEEIKQLEG